MDTTTYTFTDNTDYKNPSSNLNKTNLLKIIKRMRNIATWGNLYSYSIEDSNGLRYQITTTKNGKPNGFELIDY